MRALQIVKSTFLTAEGFLIYAGATSLEHDKLLIGCRGLFELRRA